MNKRCWKLARVIEPTFFAENGELSGAKCRLANGQVISRHLRQLALLEADTSFRGKLLKIGPRSHDQSSKTEGHKNLTSEVGVPETSTSSSVVKNSCSTASVRNDSLSDKSSVEQKKVTKVQFCADGAETILDIGDYSKMVNRTGECPEDPKHGISTYAVLQSQNFTTDIYDRCPAPRESTGVDERRCEPLLVRPLNVRRTSMDGCSDQAVVGGGISESGELASGQTAGDVARPTSATTNVCENENEKKRKRHRGIRVHKKAS